MTELKFFLILSELKTSDTIVSRGSNKSRGLMAFIIILAVLIIDQAMKIWVKTNFYLGESYEIFSWFHLAFIQNNGMAFGWEIGSKLLLTLLRIVTVGFLIYYLYRVRNKHEAKTGYLVCLALIIAGAAGNIIDCAFYGLIFDNPMPPHVAQLFPEGGGYGTFLHGKVVDMLYFPLMSWTWPTWIPIVGGEYFIFFSPVFNFADAAISVAIIWMIIFYSNQISEVPFLKELPLYNKYFAKNASKTDRDAKEIDKKE